MGDTLCAVASGRSAACGGEGHGRNDSGAAALWPTFLQKHARVLSELEALFPQFAMELRAQIHSAQLERELQSAQVLQVLQQQDAEIDSLQRQLRGRARTLGGHEVGTQTTPIAAAAEPRNAQTQCQAEHDTGLYPRIEEQHEQIEVLLDELEYVRAQLDAAEETRRGNAAAPTRERATSTDPETGAFSPAVAPSCIDAFTQYSGTEDDLACHFDTIGEPTDATAALSRLEQQLRVLERQNHDLQLQRELLLCDETSSKSEGQGVQRRVVGAVGVDNDGPSVQRLYLINTESIRKENSEDPSNASAGAEAEREPIGVLNPKCPPHCTVVTDEGHQNQAAQDQSRCSSQFGPSCEEASLPSQQDRLVSGHNSFSRGARTSAANLDAAVLRNRDLMEENERQRLAHEQELEECLKKAAALTSQNAKLTSKLEDAKQRLQSFSSQNRELLKKLQRKTAVKSNTVAKSQAKSPVAASDEKNSAAMTAAELQREVEALPSQLASREQENLALLQSLTEIKERHSESQNALLEMEDRLSQAKEEHHKQLHEKEIDHVNKLNVYMDQVNERLQKLESDNALLVHEKQQFEVQLRANQEAEKKRQEDRSHVVTVSEKSTETISKKSALMAEILEKKNRDLKARVHQLETQLTEEKITYEALVEINRASNQQQREPHARQGYKKTEEIEELKVQLLEEFNDFKASSNEAAQESEKRIVFLTACVEECSRLVDTPKREKITTRDIYETIVALSKNLAVAAPKKHGAKGAKNSAVRRASSVTPSRNLVLVTRMQGNVPRTNTESSRPQYHEHGHPRHQQSNSQETLGVSDDEARMWVVRAATLQQQLRTALLKNSNFEDVTGRLELQIEDLKCELKERMAKELVLTTKNGLLKAEVMSFKTNFATLSSRYNQLCDELRLRIDELQVNGDEMARMRTALQRKSELLAQSKGKIAQLTDDLQKATLKVDFLTGGEKRSAQYLQKAKEQMQLFRSVRRQVEAAQAHEYQLAREIEGEKERNANLQVRIKALRAENSDLRLRLGDLKKGLAAQNDEVQNAQASTLGGGHAVKTSANATANQDLQDEVKALRRRVLKKQQLAIAQKSKLTEAEAEIGHLRTKLFDAGQINRELQLDQANRKESAIHHVAAMREDMEALLSETVGQLDGLRASIYDSLELFVHCGSTKTSTSGGILRFRSPTVDDEQSENQVQLHEDAMFSMRKWTDLSVNDLDALHLQQSVKQRRQSSAKEEGKQFLLQVERALEQTPEDCRAEIYRVLEFLIARERELHGPSEVAPSY